MSSGRFFAVQERDNRQPPTAPWSFATADRYATAEDALKARDQYREMRRGLEFRAVEVHVSTEIAVVE